MRSLALLTLTATVVLAAPAAAQPGPRVVKLVIHPARPPVPAMRYELLPELRNLRPGNAALGYFRAYSPEWYPNLTRGPDYPHFHEWLEQPLNKAPLERVAVGMAPVILKELDRAARMDACDWQMVPRLREESFALLIPDMQGFRTLSTMLALRCRLEIRERQFDKAVYTLQTGLALSRHVGEAPTLITYLIAATCAHHMLGCVEQFVQQPGAPNLYWALTDLPRPLIDLRRPLQGERVMVDAIFPEVRRALDDPKAPPVPVAQHQANLKKLTDYGIGGQPLLSAVQCATLYPRARQYLLAHGRTTEQIASLSVTQVALMYSLAEYDRAADDFYKLNKLPYWEAAPRLQSAQAKAHLREAAGEPAFVRSFLFNPARIYYRKASLQRWVDLLRCVEAIRLYAEAHGGALPATLGDIREVPIPSDAVTGKAFPYRVDGRRAVLEAPAPPGETAGEHNAMRLEITLAAVQKQRNP